MCVTVEVGYKEEEGAGRRKRMKRKTESPKSCNTVNDDIWATIIDHVLVHGMPMREAGLHGPTQHQWFLCGVNNPKIQTTEEK